MIHSKLAMAASKSTTPRRAVRASELPVESASARPTEETYTPSEVKAPIGLGQKIARVAAHLTRKLALNLASPFAMLFGAGLGVSPANLTGADELHKQGLDGTGVRVAILDQAFTKFGKGEEDVLGVYETRSETFTEGLKKSTADPIHEIVTRNKGMSFHGNAMANIITGESFGLTGVAPGAEIIGVSVLDDKRKLTPEQFLRGLQWVADHHKEQNIKAISASVNYRSPTEEQRQQAQEIIDRLAEEGVVTVVAAGNRGPGPDTVRFPADLENVLSVGATTPGLVGSTWDDKVERYSSRGGPNKPGPKLMAHGGDIFTKDNHGSVELTKGTSNSTPMVAGAIAILSQGFPEATSQEKIRALLHTAVPITGDSLVEGYGLMDLSAAYREMKAQANPVQEDIP